MLTPITAVALLAGICVHGAVDTTGQCAAMGGACEGEQINLLQMAVQLNHSQSRAKAIQSHGQSPDAWGPTIKWLRDNNATVTDALTSAQTHHGGANIRGVVSTEELGHGSTILNIPEHLWLHSGSVPEIQHANLDCDGSDTTVSLVVAVALETQKGDASHWAPYLKVLPTLADYKSSYPRYASSSLLHDFRALPLVSVIEAMQEHDSAIKKCFAAWQKSSTHLEGLSELTWDDMLVALARTRTRVYSAAIGDGAALIPGSDLLNTASSQVMNTKWGYPYPEQDHFKLTTTTSVPAGQELYDDYCASCSNDRMLLIWGVYLEDNPNALASLPSESCSQLRQPVLAALNTREAQADWTAPRCNAETLSADQGPTRCSLARLAWESCAQHWEGKEGTKIAKGVVQQSLSLLEVGKANMVDVLAAIHSSRIHGVHPSLVPSV